MKFRLSSLFPRVFTTPKAEEVIVGDYFTKANIMEMYPDSATILDNSNSITVAYVSNHLIQSHQYSSTDGGIYKLISKGSTAVGSDSVNVLKNTAFELFPSLAVGPHRYYNKFCLVEVTCTPEPNNRLTIEQVFISE